MKLKQTYLLSISKRLKIKTNISATKKHKSAGKSKSTF